MLSWTKLMNDLSILFGNSKSNVTANLKTNKDKPWREKEKDVQKGRKRYQERLVQDKEAKNEIEEYKKQERLGDTRV